ncbi:hypothetical protein B9Z55_003239 [Caenorhabditis nigoni]|uniref:Uncharacterized protein n=1 Tax=Caenorhabditis nigoni TaxID=1611254 RepID=A0A2G5VP58_9PELO|nr:hypothetical protein B9Z55_003239 [Caenorhabditis nigoni]
MKTQFTTTEASLYLDKTCGAGLTDKCSSAPTDILDACKTNMTEPVCKEATRAVVEIYCVKKEDAKACSYLTFVFDLWNLLIGAGGGSLVIALLLTLVFVFIYRRKMKKIRKAGGVSGVTSGTVSQDGTSGGTGTTGTGTTGNRTTGNTQNANNQMTMNRY